MTDSEDLESSNERQRRRRLTAAALFIAATLWIAHGVAMSLAAHRALDSIDLLRDGKFYEVAEHPLLRGARSEAWARTGVWALAVGLMILVVALSLGRRRLLVRLPVALVAGLVFFGSGLWVESHMACINGTCRPVLSTPKASPATAKEIAAINHAGSSAPTEPGEIPHDELPAGILAEPIICQSAEAVVQMRDIRAYSAGWDFNLLVKTRRPQTILEDLNENLGESRSLPDEALRFRVVFADGREADNVEGAYARKDLSGRPPVLLETDEASIGDSEATYHFLTAPLPPPGALHVECEWPAMGIRMTRSKLPASQLLDAAAHSKKLWKNAPTT
jgi:hypothetical protein